MDVAHFDIKCYTETLSASLRRFPHRVCGVLVIPTLICSDPNCSTLSTLGLLIFLNFLGIFFTPNTGVMHFTQSPRIPFAVAPTIATPHKRLPSIPKVRKHHPTPLTSADVIRVNVTHNNPSDFGNKFSNNF